MIEKPDFPLVPFRLLPRIKGPEITAFTGPGVFAAGIYPVTPVFQASDHDVIPVKSNILFVTPTSSVRHYGFQFSSRNVILALIR
jgi:hypothetical protein